MVLMINMNEPQYINTRLATYMLISITTGSQRERETHRNLGPKHVLHDYLKTLL